MHSNNDVIMEQDNTQYQSESPESQKQNKDDNTPRKERMEIEINKYKQLVDAISNPRILAKAIVVIAVIVVFIFLGISLVSLMLKKFFPYKAISTMQSGATIIQNEDTEVIYWLFNSADLWSNSGIKVEEGDIITVRASGAFHTAIHHAVEDANSNTTFRDDWILPTGGRSPLNSHDSERLKYRIVPQANDNVLLMQIIPRKYENTGRDWIKYANINVMGFRDGGNNYIDKKGHSKADIVIIGDEKRDIKIPHDGILHFAVNDIVLTRRKMDEMHKHVHIGDKMTGGIGDTSKLELGSFPIPRDKDELDTLINYMKKNSNEIEKQRYKAGGTLKKDISDLDVIKNKWDDYLNARKNLISIIHKTLTTKVYDSIVDSVTKKVDNNKLTKGPFIIPEYKDVLVEVIRYLKKKDNKKLQETIDTLESINKKWEEYEENNKRLKDIINHNLTELDYYRINNFVDAWYVDNVGSILIAIERKKK